MRRPSLFLTVLLLALSLNGEYLLESFDIRTGSDPLGGSYLFWDPGVTRFWNDASATGNVDYAESDHDRDGEEEMVVTAAEGGRQTVFRYYSDSLNGPLADPFYTRVESYPVLAFDYMNTSSVAVTLSLSIERGGFLEEPLPDTERTVQPGESGTYVRHLAANRVFRALVDGWRQGALRFALVQESEPGTPATMVYDTFRLLEAGSLQIDPTPVELPEGEWTDTPELGMLYGRDADTAYSPTLGWIRHTWFPWIHLPATGWLNLLFRPDPESLVFYGPRYGYLWHDTERPFTAQLIGQADRVDLTDGELYFGGARTVLTDQPGFIPGDWAWTLTLPPFASITGRPDPEVPVYGLYCWASEYMQHRAFIKEVGLRHFRLSGPINDTVVRAYSEDGARVMFTIAARDPFTSTWRNRANFDSDEAFINDYTADIEAVLDRYGPGGTFWAANPDLTHQPIEAIEIFNEPNFWYLDLTPENHKEIEDNQTREERLARLEAREELYGKLLVASYNAVKARWPGIRVVGFAAGGAASADVGFIHGVHAKNPAVAESYDILSTHPYTRPVAPEAVSIRPWGSYSTPGNHADIRNIMQAHGTGGLPLWYTELNWGITREEGGFYETTERDISRGLQAAYIIRAYALAMRLGVPRLHFMSIVDTDEVNAGLLDRDGTWRPSAFAVRNMIHLMPFPRLAFVVREGGDAVFAYSYDPDVTNPHDHEVTMAWTLSFDDDRLRILWDQTAPGALTIGTSAVEVLDMLGNVRVFTRDDGPLSLQIGPYPVFIRPVEEGIR